MSAGSGTTPGVEDAHQAAPPEAPGPRQLGPSAARPETPAAARTQRDARGHPSARAGPQGWAPPGPRPRPTAARRPFAGRGGAGGPGRSGTRGGPPRPQTPHLDLALGHTQGVGEARALRPRQVLGLLESLLQGEDLLARERGSRVFSLPIFVQQNGSLIYENRLKKERKGGNNQLRAAPLRRDEIQKQRCGGKGKCIPRRAREVPWCLQSHGASRFAFLHPPVF